MPMVSILMSVTGACRSRFVLRSDPRRTGPGGYAAAIEGVAADVVHYWSIPFAVPPVGGLR